MADALQLDEQTFLAEYWQRKPLFIRGGLSPFTPPADGDELAGLAMDSDADARIIAGANLGWRLQTGPFTEDQYSLPGPWTLMVHGVDKHWDAATPLLQTVPWLPTWRLHDIMMSYATNGGSAGPHFDHYDVFIIQGQGQRRWQIGEFCDEETPLLHAPGLKLLASFEPREEYLLSCGDVLYVPPGCAHYGISEGESTSFSVGFRAPRLSDLLARLADNAIDTLGDNELLRDAGRTPVARAGEITRDDRENARRQILAILEAPEARWLGEVLTSNTDPVEAPVEQPQLGGDTSVAIAPGARVAWQQEAQGLLVFNAGNSRTFNRDLIPALEHLCAGSMIPVSQLLPVQGGPELLRWLLEEGTIETYDD